MLAFKRQFGSDPAVVRGAPGRVNLLGDHTDYNDGFVLPTAIGRTTRVALAPSGNGRHRFYSVQLESAVEFASEDEAPAGFGRYVYGCLEVLRERGMPTAALNVCIDSEVPVGAGLSSSAALEVATLRAVRELYRFDYDDVALAKFAQLAEIRFAGVNCGIMDQMACSLATIDRMLFMDTRDLTLRALAYPADDGVAGEVLIIDSGVARTLAGSGYNERRAQCEEAARLLGVRALRDIGNIDATRALPPPLDARARHVVSENNRVLAAAAGVDALDFGKLMNASHASLRDDYEVSAAEVDFLVERLQAHPEVFGARMTGAGFGGACVALVRHGAKQRAAQAATAPYSERYGRRAQVY